MDQTFLTVDVERRGYGLRYTALPVDTLSRDGFAIDCTGAYMRPEWFDIRQGDVVRWREGGRQVQGNVAAVERTSEWVRVQVEGVVPLPPEAFFP